MTDARPSLIPSASLDREKTQLQSEGTVTLRNATVAEMAQIVGDLGIDPRTVVAFGVVELKVVLR